MKKNKLPEKNRPVEEIPLWECIPVTKKFCMRVPRKMTEDEHIQTVEELAEQGIITFSWIIDGFFGPFLWYTINVLDDTPENHAIILKQIQKALSA